MPAAAAAVTPVTLSSTTTQRSGATRRVRAAARYTSGAGFGFATLSAQNRRSPKKRTRPVRFSTASTYDVKLLLAQALRSEIAESAASIPSTGGASTAAASTTARIASI